MECHLTLPAALAQSERFERALLDADPAASFDFGADGRQLRVASTLDPHALAVLLGAVGSPVRAEDVEIQPSVCCGGCSG